MRTPQARQHSGHRDSISGHSLPVVAGARAAPALEFRAAAVLYCLYVSSQGRLRPPGVAVAGVGNQAALAPRKEKTPGDSLSTQSHRSVVLRRAPARARMKEQAQWISIV